MLPLLWSITEQMHGNLESICLFFCNKETQKNVNDIICVAVLQENQF